MTRGDARIRIRILKMNTMTMRKMIRNTTQNTILNMMRTIPTNRARTHNKYTHSCRAACAKLTNASLTPVNPAGLASHARSLPTRRSVAKWHTGHALVTGARCATQASTRTDGAPRNANLACCLATRADNRGQTRAKKRARAPGRKRRGPLFSDRVLATGKIAVPILGPPGGPHFFATRTRPAAAWAALRAPACSRSSAGTLARSNRIGRDGRLPQSQPIH